MRIDVPNAVLTAARGINARGDIVGVYVDAGEITHACLLRKGVFTTIDVPNAAVTLDAFDINARGDALAELDEGWRPAWRESRETRVSSTTSAPRATATTEGFTGISI